MTKCTKCKREKKTRKIADFRICYQCYKGLSSWYKEKYPVWAIEEKRYTEVAKKRKEKHG